MPSVRRLGFSNNTIRWSCSPAPVRRGHRPASGCSPGWRASAAFPAAGPPGNRRATADGPHPAFGWSHRPLRGRPAAAAPQRHWGATGARRSTENPRAAGGPARALGARRATPGRPRLAGVPRGERPRRSPNGSSGARPAAQRPSSAVAGPRTRGRAARLPGHLGSRSLARQGGRSRGARGVARGHPRGPRRRGLPPRSRTGPRVPSGSSGSVRAPAGASSPPNWGSTRPGPPGAEGCRAGRFRSGPRVGSVARPTAFTPARWATKRHQGAVLGRAPAKGHVWLWSCF
jgi:hypothetical protein